MKITCCIIAMALVGVGEVQASGLSTSFVDVAVMDVPLGKPRRVEDREGKSLVLRNMGDQPLVVHLQALRPEPQELKLPAKPIEDVNWVQFSPSVIELGPHETGACDVVLLVPGKRRLRNQLFQVMILSRTSPVAGSGISLSAALKSRLRFQTARTMKEKI